MRIAVKEAVDEQLLDGRLHKARRQHVEIESRSANPLDIGDLHTVDELHGQDPGRGQFWVDSGDAHADKVAHCACQSPGVVGLSVVVQLGDNVVAELVDEAGEPDLVGPVRLPFKETGEIAEYAQISTDLPGRAWPPNLDDDLLTTDAGAVHLAERCGSERSCVEPLEQFFRWGAEVLGDDAADIVIWERRHVLLEPCQLALPVLRQHLGLARHQLADLDIGGTELLQQQPRTGGGAQSDRRLIQVVQPELQPSTRAGHRPVVGGCVQDVARDDVVHLREPNALPCAGARCCGHQRVLVSVDSPLGSTIGRPSPTTVSSTGTTSPMTNPPASRLKAFSISNGLTSSSSSQRVAELMARSTSPQERNR